MELVILREMFKCLSSIELKEFVPCVDAFANEVYVVTDENGSRYVIRVLKTQSPKSAAFEAVLQGRLASVGIGTPLYLTLRSGEVVGCFEGENFAISQYIYGNAPRKVSAALAESFGRTLAKFHLALRGITIPSNSLQWLTAANAGADLLSYSGPYRELLAKHLQCADAFFSLALPQEVIHGDLHIGNVFAANDAVTVVFDLETVSYSPRILDIARTALALGINSDKSLQEVAKLIIQGFDSEAEETLSSDERDAFDTALRFTTGACAVWCANHGASEAVKEYLDIYESELVSIE